MRVVHQAIQNGVGQGGIADDWVPFGDGQLARHQGGALVVSVFEDLEEVFALLFGQRREAPVVQEQEVRPRVGVEKSGVAPVAAGSGTKAPKPDGGSKLRYRPGREGHP